MITEERFRENLSILKARVAEACVAANRSIDSVTILPVTKNWPAQAVHYSKKLAF